MRIAREAVAFVVVAAVLAAAAWFVAGIWAAAPFLLGLAFTVWFFRDPDRSPPDDPTALLSPADGRVIEAGPRRFSIFMNVFDVHVVRSPAAGRVIEAGAAEPDRKSAASAAGAPPDWQLVAKTPGGARAHTAAELTDVLVAEFTKPPRSQNLATVAALRMLLGEKSEAEILEAAAALLECRAGRAALVASTLALGVLRAEGRRITESLDFVPAGEGA